MPIELNIEKYKNQLFYGTLDAKHSLTYESLNEIEIENIKQKIELLDKLQESLFPIIKLTSSDIYEHTDDFNEPKGTNQYFKNMFNIEDDDYRKAITGAENYFNQSQIRSTEIDWLYIDTAIYSLYKHTKQSGNYEIIKKYEPLYYKILTKDSDYLQIQAFLILFWKILKWVLWIGVIIFLYIADEPIFATTLLILKGFLYIKKRIGIKSDTANLSTKLKMIAKAYTNLSQFNFNNTLLLNDLIQCRNSNIDVPNSLFEIIEKIKSPHKWA